MTAEFHGEQGPERPPTAHDAYAARLATLEGRTWKRVLDVQRPYRWNLRRIVHGRVLDVGCGLGRNLQNLPRSAVGVDHNPASIDICRARGLHAFLPDGFHHYMRSGAERFDTLLLAHVVEHMSQPAALSLLREYLPYVRDDGRLALICPQEAGFRSDATHVQFYDVDDLVSLATDAGGHVVRTASFPFPRPVGRLFRYNESCVVADLRR